MPYEPSEPREFEITMRPVIKEFDKCCTNCGDEKGDPCNTCNEPQKPDHFHDSKWCLPSEFKANCDDDGENCKRAEFIFTGNLKAR